VTKLDGVKLQKFINKDDKKEHKINEINGDPLLVDIEDLKKTMKKICQREKP